MNDLQRALIDKPDIETPWCPFCGRPWQSRHHIVERSQGGGNGPTVTVCGIDNSTGCHGRFHHRTLHLKWCDGWMYLATTEPTKYHEALEKDNWRKLPA